jgi:hypothetical protein
VAADTDYCEWLTAQPWFRSRYGNVYNILIAGGAEPQDTPEHNQIQARFLDAAWCCALADALDPSKANAYREPAARLLLAADKRFQEYRALAATEVQEPEVKVNFEVRGWDVVFAIRPASAGLRLTKLPSCSCCCDHDQCNLGAKCHGDPIVQPFLLRGKEHQRDQQGQDRRVLSLRAGLPVEDRRYRRVAAEGRPHLPAGLRTAFPRL